jgi:hypothetical protein
METLIWLAQHKSQISPIFFVLDFQLITLDVNIIKTAQIPSNFKYEKSDLKFFCHFFFLAVLQKWTKAALRNEATKKYLLLIMSLKLLITEQRSKN